ncbi:protein of unknown function (DUF2014) domain containing protein [Elaphomyces granulatus]
MTAHPQVDPPCDPTCSLSDIAWRNDAPLDGIPRETSCDFLGTLSSENGVSGEASMLQWEEEWIRWDTASPQSDQLNDATKSPTTSTSREIPDLSILQSEKLSRTPSLSPSSVKVVGKKSNSDDGTSPETPRDEPPREIRKLPSKKRAHNVVERRYRANLNDKIAELKDSVPSLRANKGNLSGICITDGDGDGEGEEDHDNKAAIHANKLNKASILSKATEYIHHLEVRNKRLEDENKVLKTRLRQLDKTLDHGITSTDFDTTLSNGKGSTKSWSVLPSNEFSHEGDSAARKSSGPSAPQGLIKVPECLKIMQESAVTQGPFSQSYIRDRESEDSTSGSLSQRRQTRYPTKLMLGALAGIMVLDEMNNRKRADSTEKGLLAVPFNLLMKVKSVHFAGCWQSLVKGAWKPWYMNTILRFVIIAILLVGVAFVVFLYLFNSRPRDQRNHAKWISRSAPDATSPYDLRRQAWLTSIQRVGVPRHRFFLEWFAVTSRCFEYCLGCLLGWKIYSWITGITEEDEKGRVKTWDIAIDAQLAGGDAEISKSRLVLTIFAAGTLPRSPARMMLKALHCRILLWRVGEPGTFAFGYSNNVAMFLAKYQWGLARELNRSLPKDHPDALPVHLATLLDLECENVMIDAVTQRASNLTWNRPTQEATGDDEALLDVVVQDPAIQSSLDALAAWWSSHCLQRALLHSFETSSYGTERNYLADEIQLALSVAPRFSAAYIRALVMKAVFFDADRIQNIGTVLSALPPTKKRQTQQASNFLDSSIPTSIRGEILISVRCAMIAAILEAKATNDTSFPSSLTLSKAISWFNMLPLNPINLTIVGFASVYHLLHVVRAHSDLFNPPSFDICSSSCASLSSPLSSSSPSLPTISFGGDKDDINAKSASSQPHYLTDKPQFSRIASELVYWARHAYNPASYGFTSELIETIETECMVICRELGVDLPTDNGKIQQVKPELEEGKSGKPADNITASTPAGGYESPRGPVHTATRCDSPISSDTGYGSLGQEDDDR